MSKIFPDNVEIDGPERSILEDDINVHPVAAFQILNKILNEKGLCLSIDMYEDLTARYHAPGGLLEDEGKEVIIESIQSSKQKQKVDPT